MSETNINGLHDTPSPVGIVKTNPSVDLPRVIVLHKKPFKLRFGKHLALGQSNISSLKPPNLPPVITSKTHTKDYNSFIYRNKSDINNIERKIDSLFKYDPSKALKLPKLESHVYGWYHNVKLSDRQRDDRRFNFGIQDSLMTKYRMQILASDMTEKKIMQIKKN